MVSIEDVRQCVPELSTTSAHAALDLAGAINELVEENGDVGLVALTIARAETIDALRAQPELSEPAVRALGALEAPAPQEPTQPDTDELVGMPVSFVTIDVGPATVETSELPGKVPVRVTGGGVDLGYADRVGLFAIVELPNKVPARVIGQDDQGTVRCAPLPENTVVVNDPSFRNLLTAVPLAHRLDELEAEKRTLSGCIDVLQQQLTVARAEAARRVDELTEVNDKLEEELAKAREANAQADTIAASVIKDLGGKLADAEQRNRRQRDTIVANEARIAELERELAKPLDLRVGVQVIAEQSRESDRPITPWHVTTHHIGEPIRGGEMTLP